MQSTNKNVCGFIVGALIRTLKSDILLVLEHREQYYYLSARKSNVMFFYVDLVDGYIQKQSFSQHLQCMSNCVVKET